MMGAPARQRGLDLDPNRVALLVDSRFAAILRAQPPSADDRQNDVGASQRFADVGAKIDSDRDVVDVHEHAVLAVMGGKAVEDASRHRGSVRTAVGDGDLRHRRYLAT
jgi:erythromycin esterase-like protein